MKKGELKRKLKAEITEQIGADHYELCRLLLIKAFRYSPVWTGAYINSHRVSIKGQFVAPPEARPTGSWQDGPMGREWWYPPQVPSPEAEMETALAKQLAKLARIFRTNKNRMIKHIVITNAAVNAELVEFTGTKTGGHTYMRAAATYQGWRSGPGRAKVKF